MVALTQWQRLQARRLQKLINEVAVIDGYPVSTPPEALIAIALKESGGVGLYQCATCGAPRAAAERTAKLLNTNPMKVLATATVDRGAFKGQVSKFYTDEQNVNWACKFAGEWNDPARGAVALASSWGTWQQTMRWFLPDYLPGTWYEVFNQFIADEGKQLKQADRYFRRCLRPIPGNFRLAFSRYNAGEGSIRINTYGNETFAIYQAVKACQGVY